MGTTTTHYLPRHVLRHLYPYAVATRKMCEEATTYDLFTDEITAELFYDLMRECATGLEIVSAALFKSDKTETRLSWVQLPDDDETGWLKVAAMDVR